MKNLKNKAFIILNFYVFYTVISLVSYFPVYAMSAKEISTRNGCNTQAFELAYANYDGSLSTKACYTTYEEAKSSMDGSTEENSDNLVILETANSKTQIIDAKYALIDYDQKISITTNLYKNLTDTKGFTYITGGASDDAAFLGLDYNSKRIKIMVSGFTGWMDKYDSYGNNQYDIIPISWATSPSYYKVTSTSIKHYLPSNLFSTGSLNSITFGPKPVQLPEGNYYSYDGKYFYQDLKVMLNDYKAGNNSNAVNATNPYYNYYLYLSHRTRSNYTVSDINDYVKNVLGYKSKANSYPPASKESMLYDEGSSFYSAESLYGVNSLLIFGVARNESGNGRSELSIKKNNLFGHSAVDSDPFSSGSSYLSVGYGIFAHAYKWLSYGFLQPGDYSGRFNGSHLGNKTAGLNVKYASDPYWGEKAAANYYQFDSYYGLQDYNYYSIALKNDDTTVVYPKKSPKTKGLNVSSAYYKLILRDTPIIIVEEVQGDEVLGNKTWYKIMSDPMLDKSLEYVGDSKSNPRITYNWDSNYVYVPAAYFSKINDTKPTNPNSIIKYDEVINPDKIEDNNENNKEEPSTPETPPQEEIKPTPSPTPTPEVPKEELPSTINPGASLEMKDANLYYFDTLSYANDHLTVKGFLGIKGMNNSKNDNISHRIIFHNVDSKIEYIYKLNRWTSNYPFEMTNSSDGANYDYSGGWFEGTIKITNLPQGDYQVFIEESNGNYRTRANFNNLFFKEMTRKFTTSNNKGFLFQMNYYDSKVPLELTVRDEGLISSVNPPTNDVMYNTFTKLELTNNNLHIRGTSHNVGVGYTQGTNVERSLILEDVSNYKRYTHNIGSITDGDYKVNLRVSDGLDKTRAWFDTSVDISNLPKGIYAIYIKTKGDGGEDYGELNDLLYTNINQKTTIDGKNVYLRRIDNKRFRIELVIE